MGLIRGSLGGGGGRSRLSFATAMAIAIAVARDQSNLIASFFIAA